MKEQNGIEDRAALSPKFTFNPKEGIDNPALVICDDLELPITLKPRVCVLTKKDKEVFGFYLRAEKGKPGHIIRQVEPGSCAQHAGLVDADRVLEVNGEYVDNTEHFKVVEKIRLSGSKITFLVVDGATYEDAKVKNLNIAELIQSDIQPSCGKPRLCFVEKGPNGFGFELRSSEGAKAPFTLSIQPEGPAERSGVQSDDRLIEINGVNVENYTYLQVKREIKETGDSVTLLVTDQKTDVYYRDKGIRIVPAMACFKHVPFRPRKLYLVKGSCGYGFLLKTEKTTSGTYGQYLWEVDAGSPAEKCGMKEGDRLLAVNKGNIEGLQHDFVVTKIRESGNQTTLMVISSEGDKYFTSVVSDDVGYKAGIRDGDMVIEVNGINIEKFSYEDVLVKIKEKKVEVALLVMNKKEYWHCKDNNIPISGESTSEDNKIINTEKGIVPSNNTGKKTNKTTGKDINAYFVHKVTPTRQFPSENMFQ
ncbi:Na(+)/H(+) exchange regulatory cofactor NHE-RF3-like isoform X3 [Scyliorhinus torazame]|uniref:Na(+)/H(+) exchange regulatory cofactor NHE-RF3-like isoform X3 n=1 Tax=Scyliorhinus torazame TaxID=75743 RepID=UPI003B5C36A2